MGNHNEEDQSVDNVNDNNIQANNNMDEESNIFENEIESSVSSSSDSTDGSSDSDEEYEGSSESNDVYHTCANCHRSQSNYLVQKYTEDSVFCMTFFEHTSDEIKMRRKFRFVQRSTANISVYKLCKECSYFLVQEADSVDAKDSKYTWPSFVWNLLNDINVQNIYGDRIWRFLPSQWRHWWIVSIHMKCPDIYSNVTVDQPPSLFVDVSHEKKVWNNDIDSYMLSRLASSCNKYMMPNILCPWGCTEFNHRCGFYLWI